MEAERTNAWLWAVVAILLIVVVAVLAATFAPYGGGYYGMMGAGWGWGVAMMLVPLVVLVLLILVLAGALTPHEVPARYVPVAPPPVPGPTALEVLNARYARGEISRDEYLRIRADLTGAPGGRP